MRAPRTAVPWSVILRPRRYDVTSARAFRRVSFPIFGLAPPLSGLDVTAGAHATPPGKGRPGMVELVYEGEGRISVRSEVLSPGFRYHAVVPPSGPASHQSIAVDGTPVAFELRRHTDGWWQSSGAVEDVVVGIVADDVFDPDDVTLTSRPDLIEALRRNHAW